MPATSKPELFAGFKTSFSKDLSETSCSVENYRVSRMQLYTHPFPVLNPCRPVIFVHIQTIYVHFLCFFSSCHRHIPVRKSQNVTQIGKIKKHASCCPTRFHTAHTSSRAWTIDTARAACCLMNLILQPRRLSAQQAIHTTFFIFRSNQPVSSSATNCAFMDNTLGCSLWSQTHDGSKYLTDITHMA